MEYNITVVLPMPGQLAGHRGVVSLRPGLSYRDLETVAASRRAAGLARQLQGGQDRRSEQLRQVQYSESLLVSSPLHRIERRKHPLTTHHHTLLLCLTQAEERCRCWPAAACLQRPGGGGAGGAQEADQGVRLLLQPPGEAAPCQQEQRAPATAGAGEVDPAADTQAPATTCPCNTCPSSCVTCPSTCIT